MPYTRLGMGKEGRQAGRKEASGKEKGTAPQSLLTPVARLQWRVYSGAFTVARLQWRVYSGASTVARLQWRVYGGASTVARLQWRVYSGASLHHPY
jgi:hypothetical protein